MNWKVIRLEHINKIKGKETKETERVSTVRHLFCNCFPFSDDIYIYKFHNKMSIFRLI